MSKRVYVRNKTIYVSLRLLIVLTIILSAFENNWSNVFTSFLALMLFTVPGIINKKFNVELPDTLESIIYIFIFSAQILGEIRNFYMLFPYWDTILHTLNGFIFAGIGFSLCELLNKSDKTKLYLSAIYISVVAVLFSVTIGTFWEFFEYGADVYLKSDMQKDTYVYELNTVSFNESNTVEKYNNIKDVQITYQDNNMLELNGYLDIGLHDTMKDMIVNFIGALVFAFFGYFYEKGVSTYEFAKNFIPKKKKG